MLSFAHVNSFYDRSHILHDVSLDIPQGAFFGIGAYALAIMFTEYGFGPWQICAAIAAAVAVAAAVAAFTGWLSFYPG